MIKKLVQLADHLDNRGFRKEANIVDTIIKIFASDEDEPGLLEDMTKLMQGYDTDLEPKFPELRNDSPYRPSEFTLDKADVWYTYSLNSYDERDRMSQLPDTLETMHKLEESTEKPSMKALVAFPEGVDFILDFEAGHSLMSSQSHDADNKHPLVDDVLGDIDGASIRNNGLLVTNEQFKKYAKEHGFNVYFDY